MYRLMLTDIGNPILPCAARVVCTVEVRSSNDHSQAYRRTAGCEK